MFLHSTIARLAAWWRDVTDWKPTLCCRCGIAIPQGLAESCLKTDCKQALCPICERRFGLCVLHEAEAVERSRTRKGARA
jgi:hypothetical protein